MGKKKGTKRKLTNKAKGPKSDASDQAEEVGDSKKRGRSDATLEKEHPKKRARTEARMKEDPYWSDFSESEDDENELTAEGQIAYLGRRGSEKKAVLTGLEVPEADGSYALHHPQRRKVFAARRTNKDALISSEQMQFVRVGQQYLNIQKGTGHFVTPGGNLEARPEGVAEPPAEYKELFEKLKQSGADPNAQRLCTLLKIEKPAGDKLTDRQVAALTLYYMNHDAQEIEKQLKERTQLTENLSKLIAIFGIAEQSRGFEAEMSGEQTPYDVSLLIKQGLTRVINGDATLQEVFYQGKGGAESIFLGAPSEKHSPQGIGGAAQLRNPLGHKLALERQMKIFPTRKKAFKAQLNTLKTASKLSIAPLTKKKQEAQKKRVDKDQVETATSLRTKVEKITVPESTDLDEFLNNKQSSLWWKTKREIQTLQSRFSGNKAALKILQEADASLAKIRAQAKKMVGL